MRELYARINLKMVTNGLVSLIPTYCENKNLQIVWMQFKHTQAHINFLNPILMFGINYFSLHYCIFWQKLALRKTAIFLKTQNAFLG